MVAISKVACLAFTGAAVASPLSAQFGPSALFAELKSVPASWTAHGPVGNSATVKAQIGLKQSNIGKLQAKLLDISNPKSKNYGQWMSKEALDVMTAPSAANVAAVKAWLASHGITEVTQPTSDWIEFTVPVSKMESLLDAKYEMFKHTTQDITVPRTKQYSIPKELHSYIDLITPTTAFYERIEEIHMGAESKTKESKRQSCDGSSITPDCINQLYNVDYTSSGSATVGTTQFLNVGASHDDYAQFAQSYKTGLKDFQDVSVSQGSNPGSSGDLTEGNLDTQYAGGVSSPNTNEFLAVGPEGATDEDFNDGMANFASYLNSASSPPSAVSTSYGGPESAFDQSYMTRVCNDFMKAGARGISVFFSSGDSGIAPNKQQSCDGTLPNSWPAVCPWSTAVGGTQFNSDGTEAVAQFNFPDGYHGSSGGGFSSAFDAPDYQSSDTSSYQQKIGNLFSGQYSTTGRGYPDISLVALNYQVIVSGAVRPTGGTSASSPTWAGLVSVLNDYRKSEGKPNLGFINPLLYGSGRSALRDVTQGNNYGCNMDGYPALSGWDAATGLGTLDFGKLRALI